LTTHTATTAAFNVTGLILLIYRELDNICWLSNHQKRSNRCVEHKCQVGVGFLVAGSCTT